MPHLHSHYAAMHKLPNGQVVHVAPSLVLAQMGPRIQIRISLPDQFSSELSKKGEQLPAPVAGQGLIDTGAGITSIDNETAQQLKLPVIDQKQMASATHTGQLTNIYPVKMEIISPNASPIVVGITRMMGATLKAHGIIALIGRDILSKGVLIYNGEVGSVTLCLNE